MYHIVYLTTNLINNKIYVGVHSTFNLEDGYLGSGFYLKRAIKSRGIENFKREILYYCLSSKDAYEIETKIVNTSFIQRTDTYNLKEGGIGGKNYTTKIPPPITDQTRENIRRSKLGTKASEATKLKMSLIQKNRVRNKEEIKRVSTLGQLNRGKKHNTVTIQKIKEKRALQSPIIVTPESNIKRRVKAIERCKDPHIHYSYKMTSPDGIVYTFVGMLKNFSEDHNLSLNSLKYHINKGKITQLPKNVRNFNQNIFNIIGWTFERFDPIKK